jgi:hypothetical protein
MFRRVLLIVLLCCAGCSIAQRPLVTTQHRRSPPSHREFVIITAVVSVLALLAYPIATSSE